MLKHLESFSSTEKISDTASDLTKKILFTHFQKELTEKGWKALPELTQQYLESLNVQPIFQKESDPSFEAMRHRLETDSGIIISNHPGFFDYPLILSALNGREDIKIFIADYAYKQWSDIFGPEHFLSATSNLAQIRKNLEEAGEHIKNGGVVLIFPTGMQEHLGNDEENEKSPNFKAGFKFLLKHTLRPTDMVYSFHVESMDVKSILDEKMRRGWGAASGTLLTEKINPNKLKEKKTILIDESCSDAAEWQKIANEAKFDADKLLTRHFEEQFKTNIET